MRGHKAKARSTSLTLTWAPATALNATCCVKGCTNAADYTLLACPPAMEPTAWCEACAHQLAGELRDRFGVVTVDGETLVA